MLMPPVPESRMSASAHKPLPFPIDVHRALYEASSLLLEPAASHTTIARLVEVARRFVPASAYAVWRLIDDDSGPQRVGGERGAAPEPRWQVLFSEGLAGDYPQVVATDPREDEIVGPFVFEDVQEVPVSREQKERYARDGIQSMISLPLRTQGSLFGALTLYFRQRHSPAPGELELLAAIANIGATALKNALLFESLKQERERLALAQDAAKCWSWEINLHSGDAILSRSLAEVWPEAANLDAGTLRAILAAIHPDDRPQIEMKIGQAASDVGREHDAEYRFILPTGALRWVYSRGRCIEKQGSMWLVGISVDITARRIAAEALQRSEMLAAAGRMAATVAHEVNNPLEAVTNLLYLLDSGDLVRPDGRRLLKQAQDELARVAHLTKQTLGFYRDTSKASRFRFSEVFAEVQSAYWPKIEKKSIAVEQDIEAGEPEAHSYRGEARQILSNLLSNAIDAVRAPAHIRFSVRRRDGDRIQMILGDNGVGIPPENLERIFDPFFTTKVDVGTGLGLWVTRELVEKRGGSITVASGNGWTEFRVDFPLELRS